MVPLPAAHQGTPGVRVAANLDAPADPSSSDYPARPEWYFLSLFQMLKLFPGSREMIGTIIIPRRSWPRCSGSRRLID